MRAFNYVKESYNGCNNKTVDILVEPFDFPPSRRWRSGRRRGEERCVGQSWGREQGTIDYCDYLTEFALYTNNHFVGIRLYRSKTLFVRARLSSNEHLIWAPSFSHTLTPINYIMVENSSRESRWERGDGSMKDYGTMMTFFPATKHWEWFSSSPAISTL